MVKVSKAGNEPNVRYRIWNPTLPPNTFTVGVEYGSYTNLDDLFEKGFYNRLMPAVADRMRAELEETGETEVEPTISFEPL
jgi:hypothetical protein